MPLPMKHFRLECSDCIGAVKHIRADEVEEALENFVCDFCEGMNAREVEEVSREEIEELIANSLVF